MFFNILNENAALIILSCGMSIVMITGGIDISVGKLTALICMSAAVNLDYQGGNVLTAVLLSLAIGIAFGFVQGFLVAYLDIQPFIVTLAGMFFAKGMTTIVNSTQSNVQNEAFVALKNTRVSVTGTGYVNKLGVYVPAYVEIGVIIALLTAAVLFVILRWTKLGRSFHAVGGNAQSANMLGINVKHKIPRTSVMRPSCRHWRLCIFFARWFWCPFPCDRSRDECYCFFDHRRHDAYRRGRQYNRYFLWSAFSWYNKEYSDDAWP